MSNNRVHIKVLFLVILIFQGSLQLFAQENLKLVEGEISYITGQSIYVKYLSTKGIENGDTLFMKRNENLIPVLVVQHHSSISCLCNPIGENKFKVSERITAKVQADKKEIIVPVVPTEEIIEKDVSEQVLTTPEKEKAISKQTDNVTGRLSLSSYSSFSGSYGKDLHRFRYRFSMKALNIYDSKVSAETYISFSHKLNQWDVVQENLNNALKIYSLALSYDFNPSATLWVGRKINPKIANVGAVDGVQFQKQWNQFFAGAVVGTRPDYSDYGFNPDLLEYGAYIGQSSKTTNGIVQSSLAFFEQRNSGEIDRRFVYLQHSNSFIKNMNLFSSVEVDLYKVEDGEEQSTFSLTSLYLSLRYRFSRRLSVYGSYDNRKNVIYYETFKNYAEEIFQQASRQGFRFRVNYRPLNYLNLGLNAGTRNREGDRRPTNSLRGYATYSRIPKINASLTLSANLMQTSYLDGQVYGARLSKDIIPGKIHAMLNYRRINFDYTNTESQLKQDIGEIDFSFYFSKKMYMSVNFESTFQEKENYNRIYLNLRRKF